MRAAMRLELLRSLQARELGLAEIENRVKQESSAYLSSKFKSKTLSSIRDPDRIRSDMRPKVRDAYQAVRETAFERSKLSKKLNKLSGKDPDLVKRVFKQLDKDASWIESQIRRKNEKKIKTLDRNI